MSLVRARRICRHLFALPRRRDPDVSTILTHSLSIAELGLLVWDIQTRGRLEDVEDGFST